MFRNANAFTRNQDNSTGTFGQDLATFMLGFPTAGTIDINAARLNITPYHGVFVQDDWKISDQLTLNLGLRYEYEGATRDSENRNVRGFDPAAAISIEGAVKAAYAASPIPQIAPSAFSVRGGLQFASDADPGFWNADKNNFQPRLGFAYKLSEMTVVRGGFGVYTVPFIISGNFQPGFSQTTTIVPSNDLGLTFNSTLANPFPSGVVAPAGASRGADTFLGQDLNNASGTRFVPLDFANAQNTRYLISVQRELPNQWLLEGGYTGSHGWNLTTGGGGQAGEIEMNAPPAAVPVEQPRARSGDHRFPGGARSESLPRAAAGHGVQRRDRRALAAAAAVPAVRQRPDLRRQRHQQLSLRAVQGGEAIHEGLYGAGGLHLVAVQGTGVPAESVPTRPTKIGRRRRMCRTASRSAAFSNSRSATGGRLPPTRTGLPMRSSAAGACRRSDSCRAGSRLT